jgi:hypothetical protein
MWSQYERATQANLSSQCGPPVGYSQFNPLQKSIKIGILISADPSYLGRGAKVAGSGTSYSLAVSAVQCWAASKGYHFFLEVHDLTSTETKFATSPYANKIVAAKKYLPFVDWLLFLDNDCVIVNYTKTLEEIIAVNQHSHIILHERLHNSEISSAVWLVKRSNYTIHFLDDWLSILGCVCANERALTQNNDNGALVMLLAIRLLDPSAASECRALYESSQSWDDYLRFARLVHDRINTLPSNVKSQPITIMRPENGWFRVMEFQWHNTGAFGVKVGPNIISMWNRWLGQEFIVHTKEPEILLDQSHAKCTSHQKTHLRSEWLTPFDIHAALSSYEEEVVRFGHPNLVDCFPVCPSLYAGVPVSDVVELPAVEFFCDAPCQW